MPSETTMDAAAGRRAPAAAAGGDALRRLANVAGAAGEIAASWYVARAGTDRFARPAAGGDPPIIPDGYAFAIWGPIYAGMLGYAAYQALPGERTRALFRRTGWPAAAATAGGAAWVLVAQSETRVWANVAILAGMTAALGVAHHALEQEPPLARAADRWLVRAPLGLFFGWCSVAVFANLASALRTTGVTAPGRETVPTLAMLAGAAVATTAVARSMRRPNPWYAGAVAWGLAAVAVANVRAATRPPNPVVAGAAAVAALAVLATLARGRRA